MVKKRWFKQRIVTVSIYNNVIYNNRLGLQEPEVLFSLVAQHTVLCKHWYVDFWITVLVLVMHNHHWNAKTETNFFGQTKRKRDRETDRVCFSRTKVVCLHRLTMIQSPYVEICWTDLRRWCGLCCCNKGGDIHLRGVFHISLLTGVHSLRQEE